MNRHIACERYIIFDERNWAKSLTWMWSWTWMYQLEDKVYKKVDINIECAWLLLYK